MAQPLQIHICSAEYPLFVPSLSLFFDAIKVLIVYHGSMTSRHLLSYTHHVNQVLLISLEIMHLNPEVHTF